MSGHDLRPLTGVQVYNYDVAWPDEEHLIKPKAFVVLKSADKACDELAHALRDHVKEHGARGDWMKVAERFADYWNGPGSWAAMAPGKREGFARATAPNFHEWDAVMSEKTPLPAWRAISARTLLLCGRETVRSSLPPKRAGRPSVARRRFAAS